MVITANSNGSWSERNIENIAGCMDIAFANVLETEFARLTAGKPANQIDAWLYRSQQSINRLRSGGGMPDYSDPMVVLRYVLMYQLGHVNLAYTIIKDGQHGQRLTNTEALQVVDFGAGTLAMSFGTTMAVADALADGENISEVRIDAIDTGRPMMELGLKLWNEFGNEASRRDGMEPLVNATQLMRHSLHDNPSSIKKFVNSGCWLSSLHTLYDDNEVAVKSALSTLCGILDPNLVALSCFSGKYHIADRVVPMGRNWKRERDPQLLLGGFIDNSLSARIAFEHGFQPSTWHSPRLYTDVFDAVTLTSRVQASRQATTPKQPSPEAERERRAEEAQQREYREREGQEETRQRLEHERQQQRQEEARRHREQAPRPAATTPKRPSPEAERLRERQRRAEEVQQREARGREKQRQGLEQERQQQRQEEARRHRDQAPRPSAATPKQPSPEAERLRERQRRAEEVQQREARERERQRREQEAARRHSDRGIADMILTGLSRLFRGRPK